MKYVRKIELNSLQQGDGSNKSNIKLVNILQIISRLAMIKGYNENGNILGLNGDYLKNTDLVSLLLHSMSPGKILNGEIEFIDLLRKANISPLLILNETFRSKLLNNEIQNEKKENNNIDPFISINTEENKYDETLENGDIFNNNNIENDSLIQDEIPNKNEPKITHKRKFELNNDIEDINHEDFSKKPKLVAKRYKPLKRKLTDENNEEINEIKAKKKSNWYIPENNE
ncbi:MAG: hypothetical protein QM535_17585 [Limnohabitans sp.]|nr:hypothetical protein [Limnohabitans sp.]